MCRALSNKHDGNSIQGSFKGCIIYIANTIYYLTREPIAAHDNGYSAHANRLGPIMHTEARKEWHAYLHGCYVLTSGNSLNAKLVITYIIKSAYYNKQHK